MLGIKLVSFLDIFSSQCSKNDRLHIYAPFKLEDEIDIQKYSATYAKVPELGFKAHRSVSQVSHALAL